MAWYRPGGVRIPIALACGVALVSLTRRADAIRPFVTDDARVVGERLGQIETWILIDRSALAHNALFALGPTPWLEVTAGLTQGPVYGGSERGYSITGPIVQGKALFFEPKDGGRPGLALAGGILPPLGRGGFTPPGWSSFVFLASTASFFREGLLVHANLGTAVGEGPAAPTFSGGSTSSNRTVLVTAGVGFQARVLGGLHAVAEVYHGDPYDAQSEYWATQAGFRHIISDDIQIDGTFGTTLQRIAPEGESPHYGQWATLGLRLVSPELW